MKRLLTAMSVFCLLGAVALAAERTMLARVTVYWASGGSGSDQWTRKHKAATKVRLRSGHCAVDPRRIPYGSKVILPDATLTAVDTGGHVKSRRAARRIGRTAAQRSAVVVDRFFETKAQALAWARNNPHFMRVRVVTSSESRTPTTIAKTTTTSTISNPAIGGASARPSVKTTSSTTKVAATGVQQPPTLKTTTNVATANTLQTPVVTRPALRNSVSTPRTPVRVTSLPPPPANAVAASKPTATQVGAATTPASNRLASNSTVVPRTNPNIMIHGPSHHGRAVAYLP